MSTSLPIVLVAESLLDDSMIRRIQDACEEVGAAYRVWPTSGDPVADPGRALILGGLPRGSRTVPAELVAASHDVDWASVVLLTDEEIDHHHIRLHDGAVNLVRYPADGDNLESVLRQALTEVAAPKERDSMQHDDTLSAREFWARGLWGGYVGKAASGKQVPAGMTLEAKPSGLPLCGYIGHDAEADLDQVLALAQARVDDTDGNWLPTEIADLCKEVTFVGLSSGTANWKILNGSSDHEIWLISRRRIPSRQRLGRGGDEILTVPVERGDLLISSQELSSTDRDGLHDTAFERGGAVAFSWLQRRLSMMDQGSAALLVEVL